jgi:hypothetical protein
MIIRSEDINAILFQIRFCKQLLFRRQQDGAYQCANYGLVYTNYCK